MQTKKRYGSENAEAFYSLDASSQTLKNQAEKYLLEELVKISGRFLEIGCGNGHLLQMLPPSINAIGLELSRSMIAQAGPLQKRIIQGDVCDSTDVFIQSNQGEFDCVYAHYVFTELTRKENIQAFLNINSLLKDRGKFYFIITDPRTNHIDFPGYRRVFAEDYKYTKTDLPFTVLLQDGDKHRDVGIRDYHNPIEAYDTLLLEAGFAFKRKDITLEVEGKPTSYAVLYICEKMKGVN